MFGIAASLPAMQCSASIPDRLISPSLKVWALHPWPAPSRVVRGGSWNNQPENLRSANRNRNNPTNRNNNNGFRLASTLTGRVLKFTDFKSEHELRPGPVMTIKRASGLHVVGAPPSCGKQWPGRRPPHT
jgi:hypothetical protein